MTAPSIDLSAAVRVAPRAPTACRARAIDAHRAGARDPPPCSRSSRADSVTRDAADRALEHVHTGRRRRGPVRRADPLRRRRASSCCPAITSPPMLRDFMAFEKHLVNVFPRLGREIPDEWYRRPVYYKANTASIGAHRQDVAFPEYADRLDFEFEFAAMLGRDGTGIAEDDAAVAHLRLHGLRRPVGAGDPAARDDGGPRPREGQGLPPRARARPRHRHGRRGRPTPTRSTCSARSTARPGRSASSADMHWRFEQMIAYASLRRAAACRRGLRIGHRRRRIGRRAGQVARPRRRGRADASPASAR